MDADLEAVFSQYHVQRASGLKDVDLLRAIDEKAEEYAEMQRKISLVSNLGTARSDFHKATIKTEVAARSHAEHERHLDEILRARKEREDRILALEAERERKLEEERRVRKQRWTKFISKLKVRPPTPSYYSTTPFKPGFLFYDGLVHAPKMNFSELRINIPHTLYYTTEIVHLHTGITHIDPMGFAVCSERVSAVEFLKLVEKGRQLNSSHPFDSIAVVMRGRGNSEHEVSKHLIDWSTFRHKIASSDLSQYSMLQKFVKSPGGKAAAIRLSYHPSTKDNKANTAYFLSSVVLNNTFNNPSELLRRCVINLDEVDSFEVFKMSGTAIKEAEEHAKALVWYLGRGYGVRFERIDLDFLKDEQGVLWLGGCQGFIIDPTTYIPEEIKAKPPQHKAVEAERKKGSFVTCKLCRLQYANHELSHLIAVRMLLVFKAHSSNRRDLPTDMSHIRIVTPDVLSQSVRVCDVCFMLITSEFQLMQTEKELALAMNIPYRDPTFEDDNRIEMMLPFLPKSLQQWRALVYFRYLANHEALFQYTELRILFEFNGSQTTFDIKKEIFLEASSSIPIDRLRLYYFFSDPDKVVIEYLRSAKARLSIFDQTNASKLVARGEFHIFSDFCRGVDPGQAFFQKKMISLFPGTFGTSLSLTATIGLSCDHAVHPRHVKTSLTRTHEVYLPEDYYCTGDPLPTPWMEIFTNVEEEISFGDELNIKDMYSSTLSPTEMRRMADITSPYYSASDITRPRSQTKPRPFSAKPVLTKPDQVTSAEISALDTRTQESIRDVFATVNNYLRERPQSAAVHTDNSTQRKSTQAKAVVAPKPARVQSARVVKMRKMSAGSSMSSSGLLSPSSSQNTFAEQFKEISRRISVDMRSLGLQSSFLRSPTSPALFATKESEKSQAE